MALKIRFHLYFGFLKPWHCSSSELTISTMAFSLSTLPHLPEVFENYICLKRLRDDSIWRKGERMNNFLMICINFYVRA